MTLPAFVKPHSDGVLLSVKVQPRASRNEIGEPLGDTLRIRVTAPPIDSAANDAVVKLLAGALGIGRGSVEVVRGRTSRHKLIRIRGLTPEHVCGTLQGD
jgi:uncharacterized protein (TIGR00251 family)